MGESRLPRVLFEMLREEWRLHSHLFGGRRFGAFPILIAILVAGTIELLVRTDSNPDAVFAGLHALAFAFGLHTGSIGLIGRDALRDLLGEMTLIVFTSRTLPLSNRRLLAVFVIKDVGYYAGLFLFPMAIGALPALNALPVPSLRTVPTFAVGWLWLTLILSFVLGIGLTLTGTGLVQRGVSGLLLSIMGTGVVIVAWRAGLDPVTVTPYGLFRDPSLTTGVGVVIATAVVVTIGVTTFRLRATESDRTIRSAFRRWALYIGDPVATKSLLSVHRSSGGFGKVGFSIAILLGVSIGLVDIAGRITGVPPSMGLALGSLLGLSGFTTLNWLTQYDDVPAYLIHPLAVRNVFKGKYRAFLVLGPTASLVSYSLVIVWYGPPLREAITGGIFLVGLTVYIHGVTVYLAGHAPNEFLFDTVLFGIFSGAIALPLVPVLVIAFALAPVSVTLLWIVGAGGLGLAGIGYLLHRSSIRKWSTRNRR